MRLNTRVKVLTPTGRYLHSTHRERAEVMLRSGEAYYETPALIRLTGTVRLTDEMLKGRIERDGPRAHRADSSAGDAGRGWARAGHTLHIALGLQAAGHSRSAKA